MGWAESRELWQQPDRAMAWPESVAPRSSMNVSSAPGHGCLSTLASLLITLGLACAAPARAATGDDGLAPPEPIARSSIVAESRSDDFVPADLILSPVEKLRRDVIIEEKLRFPARVRTITYRLPDEMRVSEAAAHYLDALGDAVVFSCRGLDCGGSNYWANNVFNVATLYGPDTNQFYVAAQRGPRDLVMVYAIERGNRRRYAHVVLLEAETPVQTNRNAGLAKRLSADGFATIEGVIPSRTGALDESSLAVLAEVSNELLGVFGNIHVVCHVYGSIPVDALLDAAQDCSTTAAAALQQPRGPTFVPFAAGPFLPRAGAAKARVELVIPRRLHHDRGGRLSGGN